MRLSELVWIYAAKLPRRWRSSEFELGFCYRNPLGRLRFRVRANRGSDAFIFGEVFEHEYYRLSLPRQPATILDLGANAGFTTVYFARAYPDARLACVEPMPNNLRVLKRNLELNRVDARVFPAAVHARDGRLKMELGAMDFGARVLGEGCASSSAALEVDALSVQTIIRRLGWDRVGLLKIDIEGHEAVLFSGACEWLDRVDAMCIECHDGFGEEDLRGLARQFEFAAVRRLPGIWLVTR